MARFYPLYCRRSDGKRDIIAKGRRKEVNQPTDEQLDQKPDKHGVSDYYREVSPDEAKHLDWRRKLGGMLARELNWKDKNVQLASENGYMLVAFPENYRLYEHVKRTEKDGKTEVKSKTHAAGGNERQDAYLYGHPEGRRKRYRSPADFFPHLFWLSTDESGDPENCPCKICSPDDPDDAEPRPVGRPRSKPEPELGRDAGTVMARVGSGQGTTKVKPESATSTLVQRPPKSPTLTPTPLAQAKSLDQHLDLQYGTFMYRSGELVWFSRGQAWGLGAVLRRWIPQPGHYHYLVQPLSHPFSHPPAMTKTSHDQLRPWLAWSVPMYTHPALNNMPEPPRYENADWQGMKQERYGRGDLEVDGSILAAKAVDTSYTLLEPKQAMKIALDTSDTHCHSMFLGAEKVWAGDALRLASGSGTDILVLHYIVEREQWPAGINAPSSRFVTLVGDTYKLQTIRHTDPNVPTPASPNNNPQLPQRLTEDLIFRNNRSIRVKGTASYWKLVSVQDKVDINDIKGRWYEASLLLPILQPSIFEETARRGEIQEASLWMNARGDCLNSNRASSLPKIPRQNIRKDVRREAFAASIASGTEIRDGVEEPLPDNVDPALQGLSSQQSMDIDPKFDSADIHSSDDIRVSRPEEREGGTGFDEFMDLDGMEDVQSQMPGFGKEYGSQSDARHSYY